MGCWETFLAEDKEGADLTHYTRTRTDTDQQKVTQFPAAERLFDNNPVFQGRGPIHFSGPEPAFPRAGLLISFWSLFDRRPRI